MATKWQQNIITKSKQKQIKTRLVLQKRFARISKIVSEKVYFLQNFIKTLQYSKLSLSLRLQIHLSPYANDGDSATDSTFRSETWS